MSLSRLFAVAVPVVCAAATLGEEEPAPRPAPPPPHAVDPALAHVDTPGVDRTWARAARDTTLFTPPATPLRAAGGIAAGFDVVGSVAVLEGDEATVTSMRTRYGMSGDNLAAVSSRFIAAFGDDYDQIAVFLAFTDALSPPSQSLAYQYPVKNDVTGLGLGPFDATAQFGSPSGRMQTVLNMKRILQYGRDAAADLDNDLYYVWAQEAAHRWLVYFRFQRPGDKAPSEDLLGRQKAHWARTVQSDGSIMDGYTWRDNGDGTFTPVDRGKRYGALDQYGMGLRRADEVPPFFVLQDLRNALDDQPVDKSAVIGGARYKATRVALTIDDIVRAVGKRQPATDPAAADLRMGVVLVTPPGTPAAQVVGESFRLDLTRALWNEFYNTAGGGRGRVCTELMHPCRGAAFSFADATWAEAARSDHDGVLAPGDSFTLKLAVKNVGTEAGTARVSPRGMSPVTFARPYVDVGPIAAGQAATATFDGRVPLGTPCGQPLTVDLTTPEKPERPGPSRGSIDLVVGLAAGRVDDLEGPSAATWRVNPDGNDTATQGRWELASPERSDVFDFVLQPGAAWSGSHAFVTGGARGDNPSSNDVSGGFTTLESPPLPLANLTQPRLSYQVYFVAADFDHEVLIPGTGGALRVLASIDGAKWTEIDRVGGMSLRWERRLVRLADKLPAEALSSPSLRVRFVAEATGVVPNVIEAVVDDVGLFGEVPSCALPASPGDADAGATVNGGVGGCGCALGGRARGGAGPGLAFALAALWTRRRRRSR